MAEKYIDQVPGRTITAGEVGRHAHLIRSIPIAGQVETPTIIDFLEALGITVVPEPTNAEKLKAILDAIGDSTGGYREHLASRLDEAGVKAPGGDDD